MKILYLTDNKEYSYHKKMIEDFTAVIPGKVLDMSDGTGFGERYYEIEKLDPDVVITFDLAGHALRTGNGTLSLNNIYARMAHILFHGPDHYGRDLQARQNLSMFTYIPAGDDPGSLIPVLTEVPNIKKFSPVNYRADDDKEHTANRKNIGDWWEEFIKDAML